MAFSPDFSLQDKFYPQNITHMPAVKFILRLDLEEKVPFLDRHQLACQQHIYPVIYYCY